MQPDSPEERRQDEISENDIRVALRAARRATGVSAADDVVQETLVSAIGHAPKIQPDRSYWIASVARRVATSMWRRESSIRHREHAYASLRSETVDAPEPQVDGQRLAELIQRLKPSARVIIEQHYFEGLSLREISEQTSVELETVRTRHYRAICQMRKWASTPQSQPRGIWGMVLGLFRGSRPRRGAVAAGMAATAVVALVPTSTVSPGHSAGSADLVAGGIRPALADLTEQAQDNQLGEGSTPERTNAGADQSATITGIEFLATGPEGQPLPGAGIHRLLDPRTDESVLLGSADAHGRFRWTGKPAWLYAVHPGYGSSMVRELSEVSEKQIELRMRELRQEVIGRVLGPEGEPLAGAEVQLVAPLAKKYFLAPSGDMRRSPPALRAITDEGGRYRLANASQAKWKVLQCSLPGYLTRRETVGNRTEVQLTLEPGADVVREVLVTAPDGRPLANRQIFARRSSRPAPDPRLAARGYAGPTYLATTDADGLARLPSDPLGADEHLLVHANPVGLTVVAQRGISDARPTWVVEETRPVRFPLVGSAPAGSTVYLSSPSWLRPVRLPCTDAGRFGLPGLPAGNYSLRGFDAQNGELVAQVFPLECVADGDRPPLQAQRISIYELVPTPAPQGSFFVIVNDPSGGRQVMRSPNRPNMRPQSHKIDGAGRVQVCATAAGIYTVKLAGQDGLRGTLSITHDGTEPAYQVAEFALESKPLRHIRFPSSLEDGRYSIAIERGKDLCHTGQLILAKGEIIGPGYALDDLEYSVTLRLPGNPARSYRVRFEPGCPSAAAVAVDG